MKAVNFMKRGKLHYAAKLLLTTYMTVGEVAYQSGFDDKKYFSKCFAKEYGDAPKKFKGFAQVSAQAKNKCKCKFKNKFKCKSKFTLCEVVGRDRPTSQRSILKKSMSYTAQTPILQLKTYIKMY